MNIVMTAVGIGLYFWSGCVGISIGMGLEYGIHVRRRYLLMRVCGIVCSRRDEQEFPGHDACEMEREREAGVCQVVVYGMDFQHTSPKASEERLFSPTSHGVLAVQRRACIITCHKRLRCLEALFV